jgi:hypothetical protein
MNAPASITITPVRVADLLAEGERMPVYVHIIDHRRGADLRRQIGFRASPRVKSPTPRSGTQQSDQAIWRDRFSRSSAFARASAIRNIYPAVGKWTTDN